MAWHRSSDYKDLSYLIDDELIYMGGLSFEFPPDGSIKIIENYKNTVLLEVGWRWSEWWGSYKPERKLKFLVPKASLAVGAVKLKVKRTGELLIADNISKLMHDSECIVRGRE